MHSACDFVNIPHHHQPSHHPDHPVCPDHSILFCSLHCALLFPEFYVFPNFVQLFRELCLSELRVCFLKFASPSQKAGAPLFAPMPSFRRASLHLDGPIRQVPAVQGGAGHAAPKVCLNTPCASARSAWSKPPECPTYAKKKPIGGLTKCLWCFSKIDSTEIADCLMIQGPSTGSSISSEGYTSSCHREASQVNQVNMPMLYLYRSKQEPLPMSMRWAGTQSTA